jgi:anaerobic magnesium-protoporphyrin IX monomethyl ester cyclase
MKIKLVRPNYATHIITPPLGLGYLSSWLRKHHHDVEIIDGLLLKLGPDRIVEKCRDADLVGITCLSAYFPETCALSGKLKQIGKTVVIGGPHATALPEQTLLKTGADFCIAGEGEATMLELAERLSANRPVTTVAGLCTPGSPLVPRRQIDNLDTLPFPDWEQIDPRQYSLAPHGGFVKSTPVAPVITSRGCPFDCSFCASPVLWQRKIRFRSPENVLEELTFLVERFGVREIHFEDDNLTLDRDHVSRLCEEILRRNIRIDWALPNGIRVDKIDAALFSLMRKAGCYAVAFGIESGSQAVLNGASKKTDLATIERAVREARRHGFETQGFFIFGLPGDTAESMDRTLDFALRLPLDKAQFLVLDILPGSELWDRYGGKRLKDGWDYNSYKEPIWLPEGLSGRQLTSIQTKAFRRFYARPKQILLMMKRFRIRQIPFYLRRLRDFRII